jgi:sugar fermentation stimulation protein A
LEAVFVRRPNRFLIIAQAGKKEIRCHCPNPGRMAEMLFSGAKLILEKRPAAKPAAAGKAAKTSYTTAGIYYHGGIAPLISARINRAAEALLLRKIIPGLREIRAEYTLGNSRFDFLCIDRQGNRHLVEVKSCSLIEYGVAMFPDAPSVRALKHIEELASLAEKGYRCHALFVIVHSTAAVFIPNLHTDPKFAAALSRYGKTTGGNGGGPVAIHAALIRCAKNGNAALARSAVPVDLSHGELAAKNAGSYLVVLEIIRPVEIEIGSLGAISFNAGWYVYAGSAMKNLRQRLNRHVRKARKIKHWHIDYLTPYTETISALPVCSYRNLECELAAALKALGGKGVKRFGCTDCRNTGGKCESHLYYFKTNPINNRAFVETLLRFRHLLRKH